MTTLALRFDANGIASKDMFTAIAWLTDPARNVALCVHQDVLQITVINSRFIHWNMEQTARVIDLVKINNVIGGRACASILYDGIKSSIYADTYQTLRNRLLVLPFDEEFYDEKYAASPLPKPEVIDVDKELSYDKKSIKEVLDEFHKYENEISKITRPWGDIEERINTILEKAVHPRLTSTYLETCFLEANVDKIAVSVSDLHKKLDAIDEGVNSKLDSLIAKLP